MTLLHCKVGVLIIEAIYRHGHLIGLAYRPRILLEANHSRPQRPRSFWSAPRIETSGQLQRHSGFEWLCKHNRLRPEPIRFVRLDFEHA